MAKNTGKVRKPTKNGDASSAGRNREVAKAATTVAEMVHSLSARAGSASRLFPDGIHHIYASFGGRDGRIDLHLAGADVAAAPKLLDDVDPAHLDWTPLLSIDDLRLSPHARTGAEQLAAAFPGKIRFTSGRRNVHEQAWAMAGHIVKRRWWIKDTYTATAASAELQAWVDAHPEAADRNAISDGLEATMNGWPVEMQRMISKHLTGDAFDVAPVDGEIGNAIKGAMTTLPNKDKVLFYEGGDVVWHVQFY